ncbi:MAG TPA: hypothetical protein VN604_08460, partial [Nitrospirota bacterium]|nr:hypothetical protein [Nitrospirota bacterium]
MNFLKHITVAAVLAFFSGCAAGIATAPADGVQLLPRPESLVAGAEEGFRQALAAERSGDADASYRLSRQVAEQFPNTVWYQRALFLMERALIRLESTNEAEAMMLRIQQEYPELADYAVLLLADHHASRSRFTRAGALYQHLADRWPGSFLAQRSRYQQGR